MIKANCACRKTTHARHPRANLSLSPEVQQSRITITEMRNDHHAVQILLQGNGYQSRYIFTGPTRVAAQLALMMSGVKHIFPARRLGDAGLFVLFGDEINRNCKQRNRPAGGALVPAYAVGPVRSVNGF